MFEEGEMYQEVDIPVTDDDVAEVSEMFTVKLVPLNDRVISINNKAVVNVIDDDSR